MFKGTKPRIIRIHPLSTLNAKKIKSKFIAVHSVCIEILSPRYECHCSPEIPTGLAFIPAGIGLDFLFMRLHSEDFGTDDAT